MSELPLTWMADAFRANGLTVKPVKGWKTTGRPFTFAPRGVVFHHTASNKKSGPHPALGTVVNGRPKDELPGPLCNVLVARDSTVYVIAAGRANHAGEGGPFKNIPKDSGNAFMAGVEVENNGVDEPWSDELLDTCAVVFATLLIGFRRNSSWLIGHKEWTRRKIDPRVVDMDKFRRRVRRAIRKISRPRKKHDKPPAEQPPAGGPPTGIYVVEAGDTLWSIAHEHRMSVEELKQLNGLTGTLIHVGDQLKVKTESQEVPG